MSVDYSASTAQDPSAPSAHLASGPHATDEFGLAGVVVEGRYLIEEPVSGGGFGVVYRARHLRFDAMVAIKVLRAPEQLAPEQRQAVIDRLLWEGKLLFELASLHPCIVRVLEVGTVATARGVTGYLAMEWLDGVSLAQELRQRRARGAAPRSLPEVLALFEELAHALSLAHERRVIHRDIKPGNIFIASDGRLKLVDFGLAKVLSGPRGTGATRDPERCDGFTLAYAAPEQWQPKLGPLGPWTDVHALALVCVELLSGARAFEAHRAEELRAACLNEACRPTPRLRGAVVSDRVERVFLRALDVRPARRFADVPSFWSALKQAASPPSGVAVPRPRAGRWGLTATLAAAALLTVGQSATSRHAPSRAVATGDQQKASAPPAVAVAVFREPAVRHRVLGSPAVSAWSSDSTAAPVVPARPRKPHPVAAGSAASLADALPAPVPSQAPAAPPPRPVAPLEELFHHDQLSRRK
jgi:tRNA A-37 threonylcarbamoyl transferase component Bud32